MKCKQRKGIEAIKSCIAKSIVVALEKRFRVDAEIASKFSGIAQFTPVNV